MLALLIPGVGMGAGGTPAAGGTAGTLPLVGVGK